MAKDDAETTKKGFPFKQISLILLIVILLGATAYFFMQTQSLQKKLVTTQGTDQKANQEEIKKVTAEVGELMVLPKETPTIATVSDTNKLKNQPFFKQAKNGDKVLFFQKAQLAILYSPQLKKIVNVGPVNLGAQQPTQAKIVIRNGTSVAGLAAKAEAELKQNFPGIQIAAKEQATAAGYEKTIVVSLTETSKAAAETLAKYYETTLSELPAGESNPDGMDILIILGNQTEATQATPAPTPGQ